MSRLLRIAFLIGSIAAPSSAAEPGYELVSSTLTYHVSHVMHKVEGVSHSARGKGACKGGACEFLVAAPVKSFDSGDTNRDQHMLQCTRGGQYPLVVVRVRPKDAAAAEPVLDVDVEFSGRKKTYPGVRFSRVGGAESLRLKGTVPLLLSDFEIEKPSLLGVAVKDSAPVDVDVSWIRR